ncbi:PREDICTED: uncharacterized protein LOC109177136 [Ipomoea nil]|uniref:uncharacterized protein LOC109177136 n=1 Tax=Ipomoea nil TaxID=35883 RepID=UPI0009012810|nr:PREDICTED: uncharacterized protein LOC109177136 [Ipomoea nil]
MCVDYTDLNKACPMDPFPLPNIDQLVDETAGCALMSFLDAFRGYHQIFMHEDEEEKTDFTTPKRVFCYRVIAFGLKISGATYTRMVAKVFKQVYDPDMNEDNNRTELHLIDEKREVAATHAENYQRQAKAYHDKRVRPRYFQVGYYVLRRRKASQPLEGSKFAKRWEGPYIVTTVVRPGSYKLKTPKGKTIDKVWNTEHLLKYFQ